MIFYKLIKIICVRYELLFFFILSIFLFFKNAEYKQKNSFDKLKEVNIIFFLYLSIEIKNDNH